MAIRPMLATKVGTADRLKLQFPLYASPKIDGIRAIGWQGKLLSRSGKPIRNKFIQSYAEHFNGLDGELIVGDNIQDTTSGVMRINGEPDFRFLVFDLVDNFYPFRKRKDYLLDHLPAPRVTLIPHTLINNPKELDSFEQDMIAQGWEGVCLRSPAGMYKFGRSTLREQALLKIKSFEDDEAVVIGCEELMRNTNEATTSPLGYAQRSKTQDGLVPGGMLGNFIVTSWKYTEPFRLGTGFTEAQRIAFWDIRQELIGKIVKFKFFRYGMKDLPRHPVFLSFRDLDDM